MLFGLSMWELGIVFAAILLIFGPSKLPELARSFGRSLRELRKANRELPAELDGPP